MTTQQTKALRAEKLPEAVSVRRPACSASRSMAGRPRLGLSLQTRKGLAVASMTLRQPVREANTAPAVFVVRQKLPEQTAQGTVRTTLVETREQAELRRERVESITRRAPDVVITRRWIHTASHFDGQEAVVVRLPWLQRLRLWLAGE